MVRVATRNGIEEGCFVTAEEAGPKAPKSINSLPKLKTVFCLSRGCRTRQRGATLILSVILNSRVTLRSENEIPGPAPACAAGSRLADRRQTELIQIDASRSGPDGATSAFCVTRKVGPVVAYIIEIAILTAQSQIKGRALEADAKLARSEVCPEALVYRCSRRVKRWRRSCRLRARSVRKSPQSARRKC